MGFHNKMRQQYAQEKARAMKKTHPDARPPEFGLNDVRDEYVKHMKRNTKERAEAKAKALQGAPSTAKLSKMRRFVLDRDNDLTGTSGVGLVAEGIQFSNGQVVIHWLSQLEAVNVYGNALVLETLHGHGGGTKVRWMDP